MTHAALPYRTPIRFSVDGLTVTLTRHAYDRYMRRVKGVRDPEEAAVACRELERLLAYGELLAPDQPPAWMAGADTHQRAGGQPPAGYVLLMDIVFVLVHDGNGRANATTCLVRGHLGEKARAARSARARRDRAQFNLDDRRRGGPYKRQRQSDWAAAA